MEENTIKRAAKVLFLLIITLTATSCSLYFKEHFFHENEQFFDTTLPGIWADIPKNNESNEDSARQFMDIKKAGEKNYSIQFWRIQTRQKRKSNLNTDIIEADASTFRYKGKTFFCFWYYEKVKYVNNKRIPQKNEFCNIAQYTIKDGTISLFPLDRKDFKRLKELGKIEGFKREGGGRYSRRTTFHVTSKGKDLRKAIDAIGIDQLVEKKSIFIYKKRKGAISAVKLYLKEL